MNEKEKFGIEGLIGAVNFAVILSKARDESMIQIPNECVEELLEVLYKYEKLQNVIAEIDV